jgi:hypothetical protein
MALTPYWVKVASHTASLLILQFVCQQLAHGVPRVSWIGEKILRKEELNMEMTYGSKVLRPADVSIKTLDGSVIEGKVNLGYENRISDLFTASGRPFIVLFDAMHFGAPKKEVLVLNKQFIVWVKPHDEEQGTAETEMTS